MIFRQTLFGKYMCICITSILVGFLLLGTMVVYFIGRNWQDDKKEILTQNANVIGQFISKSTLAQIENGTLLFQREDLAMLENVMNTISTGVESDIFITNRNGSLLISSNMNFNCKNKIPQDAVEKALNGGFFDRGTLDGFFDTNYYAAGIPIYAKTIYGDHTVVGTVFCAASTAAFNEYMKELISIFIFVAILTFVLVAFTVGIYTYRFIKPLQQMSDAAKCFAEGDFSKRITVKSRDEIADLCNSFNNMADSLSVSEGVRRSFIANVSHELKTPMTTIAGFVDGILDGTIPHDKEKFYLGIVSDEIKRLSRMVRSMLALSKIDSGEFKLNYSIFDISEVTKKITLSFEQRIQDKNIEIEGLAELPAITICGDEDMIHQVIYNLIENAIKFTNENGTIQLFLRQENDFCYAEIKNTGPGIEHEEIVYIFDKFYKTDKSRSKDKFGMGLGLYIVKTILMLHGGDIAVSSVPGEYTSFRFFIPVSNERQIQASNKTKL